MAMCFYSTYQPSSSYLTYFSFSHYKWVIREIWTIIVLNWSAVADVVNNTEYDGQVQTVWNIAALSFVWMGKSGRAARGVNTELRIDLNFAQCSPRHKVMSSKKVLWGLITFIQEVIPDRLESGSPNIFQQYAAESGVSQLRDSRLISW